MRILLVISIVLIAAGLTYAWWWNQCVDEMVSLPLYNAGEYADWEDLSETLPKAAIAMQIHGLDPFVLWDKGEDVYDPVKRVFYKLEKYHNIAGFLVALVGFILFLLYGFKKCGTQTRWNRLSCVFLIPLIGTVVFTLMLEQLPRIITNDLFWVHRNGGPILSCGVFAFFVCLFSLAYNLQHKNMSSETWRIHAYRALIPLLLITFAGIAYSIFNLIGTSSFLEDVKPDEYWAAIKVMAESSVRKKEGLLDIIYFGIILCTLHVLIVLGWKRRYMMTHSANNRVQAIDAKASQPDP